MPNADAAPSCRCEVKRHLVAIFISLFRLDPLVTPSTDHPYKYRDSY